MHECMHAHTPYKNCNSYVLLYPKLARQKITFIPCIYIIFLVSNKINSKEKGQGTAKIALKIPVANE